MQRVLFADWARCWTCSAHTDYTVAQGTIRSDITAAQIYIWDCIRYQVVDLIISIYYICSNPFNVAYQKCSTDLYRLPNLIWGDNRSLQIYILILILMWFVISIIIHGTDMNQSARLFPNCLLRQDCRYHLLESEHVTDCTQSTNAIILHLRT